jgi:ubiquinol-cytochrome c reductase cytochrome c subunit
VRRTLVLLGGIGLLALLLTPATGSASSPGRPARMHGQTSQETTAFGRSLYQQGCQSCHGPDPAGPSNYSTVPSLRDAGGAAAVDWVLRTGRMPWRSTVGPAVERGKPKYDPSEIRALSLYVGEAVGDRDIPSVDPAQGDVRRGRDLYSQACAACHGMNGAGAALGGANIAPSLRDVSALDVAETMKIGPGVMPVFQGGEYNAEGVNSIAAYVEDLKTGADDVGGAPIGGKGPVPEGFVAWVIGLGSLVLVAWWIGEKS